MARSFACSSYDASPWIDGFGAAVWIGTLEALYALQCIGAAATAMGSSQLNPQCSKRPTEVQSQRSPQVRETVIGAAEVSCQGELT
jgi:hypothetical protein